MKFSDIPPLGSSGVWGLRIDLVRCRRRVPDASLNRGREAWRSGGGMGLAEAAVGCGAGDRVHHPSESKTEWLEGELMPPLM